MHKNSFVQGAFILAFAGFSSRFFGAGFRIALAALIGDEGIGLFQMAYPIYAMLLAISTAGIPIAISKLVSEKLTHKDYRGAFRIFKLSFVLLGFSGAVASLIFYRGAYFFATVILNEPRAFYPLLSISPAILLVTIMASLRGFFQGQQIMMPTALSQICEQIGRIFFALVLVVILLPLGLEFAAAGATFGAVAGAVFGLLVMVVLYFRQRRRFSYDMQRQLSYQPESSLKVFSQIILFALPITLGSLVMPLINVADMVVIVRLQDAGFSPDRVTALYGQLTGMANSIVHFPTTLGIALSVSLVPAIAEAYALRKASLIASRVNVAMKLTIFFALPASVGLAILARPINIFLFDNAEAAYPLVILSAGVLFLSLYFTTSGILQGMGKTMLPVKSMFYGVIVKFIFTWSLAGIPALNIMGAATATVMSFALAAYLNMREVSLATGWRVQVIDAVLKPMLAVLVMVVSVFLLFQGSVLFTEPHLGERAVNAVGTLVAVTGGVLSYGLILLLTGAIVEADFSLLPRYGRRFARMLSRFNLLRR